MKSLQHDSTVNSSLAKIFFKDCSKSSVLFSLDLPYSVTTLVAARIQIMQNQHRSCFGMFDIQSFDKRCWLSNICFSRKIHKSFNTANILELLDVKCKPVSLKERCQVIFQKLDAGLSSQGVPGGPWHPKILADRPTLSQPHHYWLPQIFRPS